MKKGILLALFITSVLTSCGVQFKYTALNHAGHIDGIYSSGDYTVDTLNEFQVRNKLRTDFNFRYDFAQYALSQPASFDWNNRLLGNRYNWNRPYWGYSYYWDRTQMWNDWVWGYPYNNWHSWNRPYWRSNSYWWSGYRNWYQSPWNNPGYNVIWNNSRRENISYINGYRTSRLSTSRNSSSNTNRRTNYNKRVILNNNDKAINTNTRRQVVPEGSNNGRRSRVRENILIKPTVPRQPNTIQPRQIRGGQRPPVLQQTRTSSQSNVKGRNGSSRGKN